MKVKRLIALLICIAIVLVTLPAVSLAAEQAGCVINYVRSEVVGGNILAEVSVTGSGEVALTVAAYMDDALVSVSSEEISLTDGESKIVSFELAGDEDCTIKAFVWDSLAGMRCLSGAVEGPDPEPWSAEVVVADSFITRAAQLEYDPDDSLITLVAAKDFVHNNKSYKKGDEIGAFHGGTEAALLIGQTCKAELKGKKILSIAPISGRNTSTTIFSEQLTLWGDLEYFDRYDKTDKYMTGNENGTVFYWEKLNDMRPKAMIPDENARIFVNYKDETDVLTEGTDIEAVTYGTGVVNFIDNDNDGDFDFALCRRYDHGEGVVDKIIVEDGVYSFVGKTGASRVPDRYYPSEERLHIFIKNGKPIEPSEIAEGDTITTAGYIFDAGLVISYVSSDRIVGYAKSYDYQWNLFEINGKTYSPSSVISQNVEEIVGVSGAFYLNADGRISMAEPDVPGEYGYVLSLEEKTKWNHTTYQVTLMDTAGKVHTYDLNEIVRLYDDDDLNGYMVWDEEVYAAIERSMHSYSGRMIKYGLEDGKIRTVALRDYEYLADKKVNGNYNAETRCVGASYPFAEDAVIFTVETDSEGKYGYSDPKLVHVVKASKLKGGEYYDLHVYAERGTTKAALRRIAPQSGIDLSKNVLVVTNIATSYDKNDEAQVVFVGIQDGATRKFTLCKDKGGYAEAIVEGDIPMAKGSVLLVGPEVNGSVDEIEILVCVTRDGDPVNIDLRMTTLTKYNGRNILTGFGALDAFEYENSYYDNGRILVHGFYEAYGDSKSEIRAAAYYPQKSTNVVTVDYKSLNYDSAKVGFGDTADVDFSPNRYTPYAFFRAYDIDDPEDLMLADNRTQVQDVVLFIFKVDNAPVISHI